MKIIKRKKPSPKTKKQCSKKFLDVIVSVFVLLLLVILLAKSSLDNSIIFLYSDDCGRCSNIEPEIKDITSKSGLRFYKLKYDEPGAVPGLIFIHHSTILISGYRDAESFKKQICGFTGLKRACVMAGENWK